MLPPTVSSAPGRATGLRLMALEAIAGGLATLKAAGRQLSRAALQPAAPTREPAGCELAPLRALRDAARQGYEPARHEGLLRALHHAYFPEQARRRPQPSTLPAPDKNPEPQPFLPAAGLRAHRAVVEGHRLPARRPGRGPASLQPVPLVALIVKPSR